MTAIAGVISTQPASIRLGYVKHALKIAKRRYSGETIYLEGNHSTFGLGLTYQGQDQKLIDNCEGVMVAIDGVFFNIDELCRSIRIHDNQINLSKLIALLYRRKGIGFLKQLVGEFALILWDCKKNKLVLAVDHFGFRPLFYRITNQSVQFGSTIAQLRQSNDVVNKIHIMRIITSLCSGPVPTQSTTFCGIQRVVPGTFVVVDLKGNHSIQRYWNIDDLPETKLKNTGEYAERLRELIFESLKCYVHSTESKRKNITVMFSGGLDSSTVLYSLLHLKDQNNVSPTALTVRYDSSTGDEIYQKVLAQSPEVKQRIICGSNQLHPFQDRWDELPQTDEPSIPVLCTPRILQAFIDGMKELDSTHMFYGSGGDTLWEGNHIWISGAIRKGQWIRALKGINDASKTSNQSYLQVLKEVLGGVWDKKDPKYFFKPLFPPWVQEELYEREKEKFLGGFSDLDYGKNSIRRYLYTRLQIENCITPRNDYFFLKHGVQEVNPFFYKPLVEFMMTIPNELNYEVNGSGQWVTKKLLRKAMAGIVPSQILDRTTKGLAGDSELKGFKEGRPLFETLFLDGNCRLAEMGLIEPTCMAEFIDKWFVGLDTDWTYNIVATEMWLRQNVK